MFACGQLCVCVCGGGGASHVCRCYCYFLNWVGGRAWGGRGRMITKMQQQAGRQAGKLQQAVAAPHRTGTPLPPGSNPGSSRQ